MTEQIQPIQVGCNLADGGGVPGSAPEQVVNRALGVHLTLHQESSRKQLLRISLSLEASQSRQLRITTIGADDKPRPQRSDRVIDSDLHHRRITQNQ
jgi:hypothetical protein